MYSKKDFKCSCGMYYVGNVVGIGEEYSSWVDEETLELLLLELNNGAKVISLPKSVAFVQFTNDMNDPTNFIHLN